jgi:hypothetical protein
VSLSMAVSPVVTPLRRLRSPSPCLRHGASMAGVAKEVARRFEERFRV